MAWSPVYIEKVPVGQQLGPGCYILFFQFMRPSEVTMIGMECIREVNADWSPVLCLSEPDVTRKPLRADVPPRNQTAFKVRMEDAHSSQSTYSTVLTLMA